MAGEGCAMQPSPGRHTRLPEYGHGNPVNEATTGHIMCTKNMPSGPLPLGHSPSTAAPEGEGHRW